MIVTVAVRHFSDPGCPWAYSASPALAVLRWRFGDQLEWRLVTIGLTEHADQYVRRGYTPAGSARPLPRALAHLRARRPAPRGRRLPARRGLRRAARQPRAGADAATAARESARGAAGDALRARHAGGGGGHGAEQRAARPGGS